MTIYIALFNLTEVGIKAAKDSPRRLDAANEGRDVRPRLSTHS